jgi:acetyl-CoA C-acetyltransferase
MSYADRDVLIVGAARTPIGSFKGQLASLSATDLGGLALAEAITRSKLSAADISEVFMGNVISAGNGQNPARQAALKAGLPVTCVCSTVNKVCASGMKAIMLAAQQIQLGQAEVVAAGGMESMSNTPFLMRRAEPSYGGFSHIDSLVLDGLTDAASARQMGELAEQVATDLSIGREAQDNFAVQSYQRSAAAWDAEKGAPLTKEVFPVTVTVGRGQTQVIAQDEEFGKVNFDKLRTLRTVFKKDNGTITAGNVSSSTDQGQPCLLFGTTRLCK